MIIGSNAAENHPISFKWVTRAMDKGAKLISVDPRFTRTSSKADIYSQLRSGTDIAFVGGMINYVLTNKLYHEEYVREYTNAAFLVNPNFKLEDGVFSGFDSKTNTYADKSTWQYQLDEKGVPKQDKTLKDPNCVFQLLKKHFSRYTPEQVCAITGADPKVFKQVCETYGATGKPNKSATIMYAMGTTQHTHGTQNIRSYAILQLLLGNIGVAGGGINALRGESNVQGSTDMCLLFHILPGYLGTPNVKWQTLAQYIEAKAPKSNDPKSANWWSNYPKYITSLLKAFWTDVNHDKSYSYLPKIAGNYSHMSLFEAMAQGTIKGIFCWGQNPAVGGPNATREKRALEKLDWLVCVDLWETETSAFWKRGEANPAKIDTEVFLLPAAASYEKEGSVVNSGRWAQWRYKATNPPGECMDDLAIISRLGAKIQELYKKNGGTCPEPIVKLSWDYGDHPDVHAVAKEYNGRFLKDCKVKGKNFKAGDQVPSFAFLQDDGSTLSGNWLYCGAYVGPDKKDNRMARRVKKDAVNNIGLYPEWSWCWPVNRRIIYNRASVDLKGNPYAPQKYVIKWENGKWIGDVPDGGWPPLAVDPSKTKYPFIMKPEGHARLFGMGRADGPLPEHYEPMESPVKNLMSKQQNTPAVHVYKGKCIGDLCEPSQFGDSKEFPIVATTYRLTEHWQAGMMTRNLPWLYELQPEPFVEMSEELAKEVGIKNGEEVYVETIRGKIKLKAGVTKRFKPYNVAGKKVHQVGIIWHWGYCGGSKGATANDLTPHVGDVNTRIPEFKAFLCKVTKA